MDLQEIKNYFEANADKDDVKAYLTGLAQITKEKETEIISAYIKSKDYLSEFDRKVTDAVQKHDEKVKPKLEKELRDKIQLELNPPKDPALVALQNQIEEMKQAQVEKESLLAQEKRINFLHSEIHPEYKDFVKLFDGSIQDDSEKVKFLNENLLKMQQIGTPKPTVSKDTKGLTRESLKTMSAEEINKARLEGKLDNILAGH